MSVRIASVQVAKPASVHGLRTAFGKRPVDGAVQLGFDGLDGDGQADRRYHGGPERALMAYAAAHYPRWREELGWPDLPHGGFAENLTVEGADEESACIGDVWRAGSALVQISAPRAPCSKIPRFWQRPDLLRRVEESGRTGWYLRVLEKGALQQGDAIELVERPHEGWTVLRALRTFREGDVEQLAGLASLSPNWK